MDNQLSTILSFKVSSNVFAVDALHVIHILEVPDKITKVPNTPHFTTGVINHHGNIIPVVDMRVIMEEKIDERKKSEAIIIINPSFAPEIRFGIYVDMISEVININSDDIKETVMDNKRGLIESYVGSLLHKGEFIHIIDIMHLSEIIDK